jgi:dTDP-4-amino-4,6-dideoxygalactose transaminase
MYVPFLDLKRETGRYHDEMEQAVARVLAQGQFILGPELEALEKEFAGYLGIPFAAGVASGTDALSLALESTGCIRPGTGDEVITSALSAAFTPLAIWRAGAVPRFVDVDPATLQIDPAMIDLCINARTRAIIPVHLYGNPCAISEISEIARKRNLAVIEDACQAHGSRWNGRTLGTFGCAAAFSFYPTKNLGACGDAGMVVTPDSDISARIRKLRHGGQARTYHHELLGCNSRLDEVQAALLRLKLKRLEMQNEIRRRIASRYDEALAGLDLVVLPVESGALLNRHLYPVRTPEKEKLRGFLKEHGIETLVHYPIPLPAQPALQSFVLPGQHFPQAEKAARELLSLPLYPELGDDELEYTMATLRRFFGAGR